MKRLPFFPVLFSLTILSITALRAQEKIPMDHSVYEFWESISSYQIASDGEHIVYQVEPGKGDATLHIYNVDERETKQVPRGVQFKIPGSSNFVSFLIKPQEDSIRQAKKEKTRKNDMPGDSLGIFVFGDVEPVKFARVKSFKVAEEESDWMVFHFEKAEEAKDTTAADTAGKEKEGQEKPVKKGSELVIYNPVYESEHRFPNVTDYELSKYGSLIAFTEVPEDTVQRFKVNIFHTGSQETSVILEGEGQIQNLAIDEKGDKVAFLHARDTSRVVNFNLFLWSRGQVESGMIVDSLTDEMPENRGISSHHKLYFSKDGDRLFFGTALIPGEEPEDSLPDEEKYRVDIWNWKDKLLQPMQKERLDEEKKRSYMAVYHIPMQKMVQIGSEEVGEIKTLKYGNGSYALGFNSLPYRKLISWEGKWYRDVYLVDLESGNKELLLKKKEFTVEMSPGGRYVAWYEASDSNWYAHDIEQDELIPLSTGVPRVLCDETNDVPTDPYPYGIAGWTDEDRDLLLYDRYDIWKVDMSGKHKPMNLTNNHGRNNKIRYRYVWLDRDRTSIDPKGPFILSGFNEENKKEGYFSGSAILKTDPEILVYGNYAYGGLRKADKTDDIVFRKENFREYPDLWLSDLTFRKDPRRVSEVNHRADKYLWGDVDLVRWTSFNNEELQGLLYTPENLDKNKKYPLLVYFYERSSDGRNRHKIPSPSRSIINITWCVSNGYVVFVPDIIYREGYPGQSAYDAIVSGTSAMMNRYSFIDKDNMALQGHSWGGYQAAWLVTRTDLYKCAMAGAPVSNMTSAYGGIRWGSGMSRMFQYERTQSRIGGTLWERLPLYLENSPLFHAPKVNTPLLMMHNDGDGAVPWYQGIEFFVALRRLNKPVWMLVYNDEEHNLRNWPNRVDLSKRMMQFFDHYLKGEPEPEWMSAGIPALDKGKKHGYKPVGIQPA